MSITLAAIEAMSDVEILALTQEHPDHVGERVFVLSLKDFESRLEMAACMALLIKRLQSIKAAK